ncbi:MAG: cadherin-like beta sandwich domain-containing protein [Oscillospiraceae bacterium]|nr:cadherin-like beta sandwich domain-containing protein [Oscillospiraceae bacterium]
MKRIISALLVLILLLSALPLAASAASKNVKVENFESATHVQQAGTGACISTYTFADGSKVVTYEGKVTYSTVKGIALDDLVTKGKGGEEIYIAAHVHEYEWTVNRDGHFYRCTCGAKHHFQEHTMQSDGTCVCGYKFMDNADLTVLWMSGIKLSPSFKKDVTEYEGKLLVKDLEKTKISAFSFDAKAEIELPNDLTLKKGTNTFEVKVTAENGTTTKTYTVTVEKE